MDLLKGCLELDPDRRLSADEALALPYFDDVPAIMAALASGQPTSNYWAAAEQMAVASRAASMEHSVVAGGVMRASGTGVLRSSSMTDHPNSSTSTASHMTPPYAPMAADRRTKRQQMDFNTAQPGLSSARSSCSFSDTLTVMSGTSMVIHSSSTQIPVANPPSRTSSYDMHMMVTDVSGPTSMEHQSGPASYSGSIPASINRQNSRSFNLIHRRPTTTQQLTISEEAGPGEEPEPMEEHKSSSAGSLVSCPLQQARVLSRSRLSNAANIAAEDVSSSEGNARLHTQLAMDGIGTTSSSTSYSLASPPDCVVMAYEKSQGPLYQISRLPMFSTSNSGKSRLSNSNGSKVNEQAGMICNISQPQLPPIQPTAMAAATQPVATKKKVGIFERLSNKIESFFNSNSASQKVSIAGKRSESQVAAVPVASLPSQTGSPALIRSNSSVLPAVADMYVTAQASSIPFNALSSSGSGIMVSWNNEKLSAAMVQPGGLPPLDHQQVSEGLMHHQTLQAHMARAAAVQHRMY